MIYVILAVVLISSAVGVFAVKQLQQKANGPYHDELLVEDFACSSEWEEFDIRGKISFERDGHNICVKFKDEFTIDIDGEGGLLDSSGSPLIVDIEIEDSEGQTFSSEFTGARGHRIAVFASSINRHRDREYLRLRVRCRLSRENIKVDGIYWSSYFRKDRK